MAVGVDLTDKKFGKLTAIELLPERSRSGTRIWLCKCECGGIKKVISASLVGGMTRSCGCEAHPRHSNNSNWKGYGDISLDFYTTVKRNAIKRGIDFNVSIEYLWDLFLKQDSKCNLSGLPLSFGRVVKDRVNRTASVDRIDSSKGYVQENIQWVHKKINIMKNTYSQEEFITLCKQVVKYTKNKL